jgi:RND family efflux transporter MFP subunit
MPHLKGAKSLTANGRKLSKATLISPCDGIVSDFYINDGEIARTTDIITSLVCENTFQVEAEVPESDIGKISLQDRVEILLDAFYGEEFFGNISKIYPTETIISGVVYYKIEIIFDDFNELIKSGMTTDLEIITQEKENVLIIPQRLITKKNGDRIVKVLSDGEVKEVIIEIGISNDQGEIEVISGLDEGDKIIK